MDSAQIKNLTEALRRIVVSDAVAMNLRVAALQGIEDLEMGESADNMTIRDVHQYTADWMGMANPTHTSDPYA